MCNQFKECSCCTSGEVHLLHMAYKALASSLSPACAAAMQRQMCRSA